MNASLSRAELLVNAHITARQAELDATALTARAACVAALRAAIAAETPGSCEAERELCLAVASHVSVGRESDGYPELCITDEARKLIGRAVAADVVRSANGKVYIGQVAYYGDLRGIDDNGPFEAAWSADCRAWDAASRYRAANKR